MTKRPVYVLGTGLGHDGSSCLLKDGQIVVAIEKERLTRKKHDGYNDLLTVQYCLDYAGITVDDLSLVVQNSILNLMPLTKSWYRGRRAFKAGCAVPFVNISHHLAHAYSAVGTSPFDQCNVVVIDGSGSAYNDCTDLGDTGLPTDINSERGIYAEKNSLYFFDGQRLNTIFKDFGVIKFDQEPGQPYLPTIKHSIGGLYAMASHYCFGDMDDAGKLMGLAPYGRPGVYKGNLFDLTGGRFFVNHELMRSHFTQPAELLEHTFKNNFQYYADTARWVQEETERAISYLFRQGQNGHANPNICYAGGVALNAVTNAKLLQQPGIDNLYIEPAAGDNGIAIGCAYYGWLQVLQQERVKHNGSTFFGRPYTREVIKTALENYAAAHPQRQVKWKKDPAYTHTIAGLLASGKTVGWFQLGSEFGPRALGHRSILADPSKQGIQQHINEHIKFREDFRPFAPAVLYEDRKLYFEHGFESPYMILIDKIRPEWKERLPGIVHVDGSCRVQTVKDRDEPFFKLLSAFKELTGISVLLNTSFNCKGMPIVETPGEAIRFFYECALDVLVLDDYVLIK